MDEEQGDAALRRMVQKLPIAQCRHLDAAAAEALDAVRSRGDEQHAPGVGRAEARRVEEQRRAVLGTSKEVEILDLPSGSNTAVDFAVLMTPWLVALCAACNDVITMEIQYVGFRALEDFFGTFVPANDLLQVTRARSERSSRNASASHCPEWNHQAWSRPNRFVDLQ